MEEKLWYKLTNKWGDKDPHTFLKSISPKVNAITPLEFESAHNDATVKHFSPVDSGTPFIYIYIYPHKTFSIYIYLQSLVWIIYILSTQDLEYIYSHPQKDCFVLSELFSVARHAGHSKPGWKPVQLYVRLCFRPLVHQADQFG